MGLQTTQMHPHGSERLAPKLPDLSFLPLSPPRLYCFAETCLRCLRTLRTFEGKIRLMGQMTVVSISEVETAFKTMQSRKASGKWIISRQPGDEVKVRYFS